MARHRIALMLITYLALILLIISGCAILDIEDQSKNRKNGTTGMIQVMLTDAPLDWATVDAMYITIRDVKISRSDDKWQTLDFETTKVNLLELQNGVSTTLGVWELEAGTYEQIRLILDMLKPENNAVVYNDSTVQPFKVPSGGQTGIKIIGPFKIEEGSTSSVLIDFDAKNSLKELGNGNLMLEPTIKVLDTMITKGTLLFVEDFGTGKSADDIQRWDEIEHFDHEDKCMVVEGSDLGGRLARIYGYDAMDTNHSFFRRIDLNGIEKKVLRLEARRSSGWIGTDLVHLELFYENKWHSVHKFNYGKTETFFSVIEIPLTEEMMETMFYIRFRNGIENQFEYLDIDNIEIYM